jgi:hypothetical protein
MNVAALIIGESGEGKTASIENLPPERTYVGNTERKPLSVKNAKKFKNTKIENYKTLMKVVKGLQFPENAKKYDYFILDSFTSVTEMVEKYCEYAFQGFEKWKQYNLLLMELKVQLKKLPMQVFIICLPEQKEVNFNENKKYARVKGKELKYGFIEKEFSIVLYTKPIYDDETGELTDVRFKIKSNKFDTTKTPRGMFSKEPPNDLAFVHKKIKEYYGEEETAPDETS